MRYIKHHLENIIGVEIYPIISLLIFFLFFVALFFYVVRADKGHISYMSSQPLQPSDEDDNTLSPHLNNEEK